MSTYSFITEDKNISFNNIPKDKFYKTPFVFIQEKTKNTDYDNLAEYSMKGINAESTLSIKFFGKDNRQIIQEMIKNTIYDKSKRKFKLTVDQDDTALTIVMRKVFLRESVNLLCDVDKQIQLLDLQVVNEVFPEMMSNIKQEIAYLKDISKPIEPIPLPINVSSAGRNTTLPSITTTF